MYLRNFLRSMAGVFFGVVLTSAAEELDPMSKGSWPIGSTNLEVAVQAGADLFPYLNGHANRARTLYVTDLLVHPESVPTLTIDLPNDPALFKAQAGKQIPVVMYIFYPTPATNPRPDYNFPFSPDGQHLFPHMQRLGEKPLIAEAPNKWPLIVYSGGYNTHGLWQLNDMRVLAEHGYIVVYLFHGDGRGVSFLANMALRPVEVRSAIDYVLADPEFGPAIDHERIGLSGASAGGCTILQLMGGRDPRASMPAAPDARVKAGFGLVPFMGASMGMGPFAIDAWFFGEDFSGLAPVKQPFFAVYGEKDRNVTPASVEAGVRQVSGPVYAVMLDGEAHLLSPGVIDQVNTWQLLFFDAYLKGDSKAAKRLAEATGVRGRVHDHKTFQRTMPK